MNNPCNTRFPVTRLRVLLADDYPAFITAIRRLLARHDYEVVGEVEDGANLVSEAVRLQPDVIVLDLHMPNVSGLDACRDLRRIIPRSKIILLTAETDADVRQGALAAGASAVVTKQAIGQDLLPAIRMASLEQHC
jgi:DNA-binding NarL/FixJ family response regulator